MQPTILRKKQYRTPCPQHHHQRKYRKGRRMFSFSHVFLYHTSHWFYRVTTRLGDGSVSKGRCTARPLELGFLEPIWKAGLRKHSYRFSLALEGGKGEDRWVPKAHWSTNLAKVISFRSAGSITVVSDWGNTPVLGSTICAHMYIYPYTHVYTLTNYRQHTNLKSNYDIFRIKAEFCSQEIMYINLVHVPM